MSEIVRNIVEIQRRKGDKAPAGAFSGILASEGESADGHIVDVTGIEGLNEAPPLRFMHGFLDPDLADVGSWSSFQIDGDAPGKRVLRGTAQIELEGEGARAEKRRDLAFMVDRGHIRRLSIALSPGTVSPVQRTQLDKEHFAFVDADKTPFSDPRRMGLFYPTSVFNEGSIVSIGADRQAVIGRSLETQGKIRELWHSIANELIDQVVVRNRDGETAEVPAWVFEKYVGAAIERYREALDLVLRELKVERAEVEPELEEVPATSNPEPEAEALPEVNVREQMSDIMSNVVRKLDSRDERIEDMMRKFMGKFT